MNEVYCDSCGLEVMRSLRICPSCGNKTFSQEQDFPTKASSVNPSNTQQTSSIQGGAYNTQGLPENGEITRRARACLEGNWLAAAGATTIYVVVIIGLSLIPNIGIFIQYAVLGPLGIGWAIYALRLAKKRNVQVSLLFAGFNNQFIWTALGTFLLTTIFITLWLLLLIIPGIIAALSYAMVYFIIVDDDSLTPLQAISKSKEMMRGHKWQLFFLGIRFLGWFILGIFTLGIGWLWVYPYYLVSLAAFYEDIK